MLKKLARGKGGYMKRVILMVTVVMMVTGCASTLPKKVSIDKDFNTTGVKTASVNMDF